MKKFLSFMLVLAMIASMMCINVAAAENCAHNAEGFDHVVGTRGDNTGSESSLSDGASNWTSSESTPNYIVATINGAVVHHYAVDLEFSQKTIVIRSVANWDVNELKYVGDMYYKLGNEEEVKFGVTTENADAAAIKAANTIADVASFKVTNYSDESVYVSASVVNSSGLTQDKNGNALPEGNKSLATVTTVYEVKDDVETEVTANSGLEVKGVTPVVNGTGTAVVAKYTADLYCADWAANFATMADKYSGGVQVTVAKITFKVSATRPAQNPTEGN